MIDTCIGEGELEPESESRESDEDGAVRLRADVDGVEWVLVVDPVERAVLTAFAPAYHR